MSSGFVTAAFFVPLEIRPPSDEALWSALGFDPEQGTFGPLHVAERRIDVLSDHVCAQLYFLHAAWLTLLSDEPRDGREVSLAEDGALDLAMVFRAGAARAHAEVAVLVTPSNRSTLDDLLERYWMVEVGDANALAAERFALLYLDDELAARWEPPARLVEGRDELPDGPGRTIFSQRGWSRWF